jgi:hypothetical protein
MKKIINISLLLSLSALVIIGFNSCEEEDDYDFSQIEPKVFGVDGPASTPAHGNSSYPVVYEAAYFRGGSSLDWSVETDKGEGTVEIVLEDVESFEGKVANITFPQRSEADSATITVVETTMGGVQSAPFTMRVALTPFCPVDMDAWAGDYTGTEPGTHSPEVTMSTTENLNELKVEGLAYFVPNSWGENWTEGDGSCLMQFGCGNTVIIQPQWIGDTDYPDSYGISGTGTFDPDNMVINLSYDVFYGWDGSAGSSAFGDFLPVEFTLNGKASQTVKKFSGSKK